MRAATRLRVPAVFVANRKIPLPKSDFVKMVTVAAVEGSADAHIVEHSGHDDIVVTRDILHAADLVAAGIVVLNDRGELFNEENIRERVSIRNFMKGLRQSGTPVPEQSRHGPHEVAAFAAAFDRELTRKIRRLRR